MDRDPARGVREATEGRRNEMTDFSDKALAQVLLRFYYRVRNRGGSGQMMTAFTCEYCQRESGHANTGCPLFCEDCFQGLRKIAYGSV